MDKVVVSKACLTRLIWPRRAMQPDTVKAIGSLYIMQGSRMTPRSLATVAGVIYFPNKVGRKSSTLLTIALLPKIKLHECSGESFFLPCANCYSNCYYNFTPVGYFWENDVIYSNSQRRIATRKINGGAKFSEIKVQKNTCCNDCIRLKFGKISSKDLLCTKIQKNGMENLIIEAL